MKLLPEKKKLLCQSFSELENIISEFTLKSINNS